MVGLIIHLWEYLLQSEGYTLRYGLLHRSVDPLRVVVSLQLISHHELTDGDGVQSPP